MTNEIEVYDCSLSNDDLRGFCEKNDTVRWQEIPIRVLSISPHFAVSLFLSVSISVRRSQLPPAPPLSFSLAPGTERYQLALRPGELISGINITTLPINFR